MATEAVTPGVITSPVFRVRGQRSQWTYPHERATPEHCKTLKNINISEAQVAEVRSGTSKFHPDTTSEECVGLSQEEYSTGTFIVECTPTKVYTNDGTTRTDITGSLTPSGSATDLYRFAKAKDQLIATNGVDPIFVKDNDFTGPSNASVISYDASGITLQSAKDLVVHRGILCAIQTKEAGAWNRTRLRWCDVDTTDYALDITKWPDRNRFEVYEGGTELIGAVDNFSSLLLFKKDGVYPGTIDGDVGFLEFTLDERRIQRGFSPIARNSIISRPEFVFCIAKEGAVIIKPDLSFEIVSQDVQDEFRLLNQSNLSNAVAWVREKDHQVRVLMSKVGAGHDTVFVWDWSTGDAWFDTLTDNTNYAINSTISGVELDLLGSTEGTLYKGNVAGATQDDDADFTWEIKMQENDLGSPGKSKNIIRFRTIYEYKTGNTTASWTLFRNRGSARSISDTISFASGTGSWNDGSTTWNDGSKWLGGSSQSDIKFINRVSNSIAPRWTGTSPAKIIGYQVEFEMLE
jgi:hypothetical protein